MESANLDNLKANPNNPRTISKVDFENLKQSIKEFGDLSGVVLNVRTGQLVGGHQRKEAFEQLGANRDIEIAQRMETPTPKGTVAIGFITLDSERYSYREVDWEPARESAANIAVNRIQGSFDLPLLAEVTYQIQQESPELLELTGQTDTEIKKLLKSVGVVDAADEEQSQEQPDDEKEDLSFRLTHEQKDAVLSAIEHVRITKDIPSQDPASMNGSALYYIAQQYMSTAEPVDPTFAPPELPQE